MTITRKYNVNPSVCTILVKILLFALNMKVGILIPYHQRKMKLYCYIYCPLPAHCDTRSYLLIVNTAIGPMAFFRPGYVRLTLKDYDKLDTDLSTHLTNQAIQKKESEQYEEEKEGTVMDLNDLNTYVNNRGDNKVPKDWILKGFNEKCKQIAAHCVAAVKNQLDGRLGLFDIIGIDFLLDEDYRVYLQGRLFFIRPDVLQDDREVRSRFIPPLQILP